MAKNISIDQQRKEAAHNYELINGAYHEAGHAIMALTNLTDIEDIEVNIEIDKRISKDFGYTIFWHHFGYELTKKNVLKIASHLNRDIIHRLAISDVQNHYGGLAAETILHKRLTGSDILPNVIKLGSEQDLKYISKTIIMYNLANSGDERREFKKECLNHAIKFLDYFWADVVLIAQGLIKNKKLDRKQVRNILLRKSLNKEYWKTIFGKIKILLSSKDDHAKLSQIILNHY